MDKALVKSNDASQKEYPENNSYSKSGTEEQRIISISDTIPVSDTLPVTDTISVSETAACYTPQSCYPPQSRCGPYIAAPLQPLQPAQPEEPAAIREPAAVLHPSALSKSVPLSESAAVPDSAIVSESAAVLDSAAVAETPEKHSVTITVHRADSYRNALCANGPRYPEKCRRWRDLEELRYKGALTELLRQGKTPAVVAEYLNCSLNQIYAAMKAHQIPTARAYAPAKLEQKLFLDESKPGAKA